MGTFMGNPLKLSIDLLHGFCYMRERPTSGRKYAKITPCLLSCSS